MITNAREESMTRMASLQMMDLNMTMMVNLVKQAIRLTGLNRQLKKFRNSRLKSHIQKIPATRKAKSTRKIKRSTKRRRSTRRRRNLARTKSARGRMTLVMLSWRSLPPLKKMRKKRSLSLGDSTDLETFARKMKTMTRA